MTTSSALSVRRFGLVALCVLLAIAVASTTASAGEPSDDELIELDEHVSVWTDSTYAVTLKNPAETDAMTSPLLAETPARTVNGSTATGTPIDGTTSQPAASALDGDSLLQFEFWAEQGADTQQFAGANTSMVIAKLDSPDDPALDGAAELSPARAAELLVAADRDDRASFDTQFTAAGSRDMRIIDDDGYFATYYGLDDAAEGGVYAFYVVKTTDGEEPTVEDGELTIDGELTVLGSETVAVQDGESTVETDSEHELGELVEFAVDADGETVDHTVAVFDESALADEQLTQSTAETVDGELVPSDITTTESAAVNGVADTESASMFGATPMQSIAQQTSEVGVLASYLATADPDNEGPAGSITTRQDSDSSEQLSVETLESWEDGSYTYIHLATAADGTTTSTTGTVELVEPESESSTSSRSSSSGISAELETNLTETNGSTLLTVENADNSDTLVVDPNVTAAGTTVTGMALSLVRTVDTFDAEISTNATTPNDVPVLNSTALSYLTIDAAELSPTDYGTLSVEFSVEPDRLSAVGTNESAVRLYQHDDGSWNELATESHGDHSYEATTTQLGTFAIGSIQDAEEALTVSSATVDSEAVEPNETTAVNATVENPTADDVAVEIPLEADGTVETTLVETVEAGETKDVRFEFIPPEAGSYNMSVAGTAAGTLEVSHDAHDETQDETPGFGISAVVSALLVVIVARRFSHN